MDNSQPRIEELAMYLKPIVELTDKIDSYLDIWKVSSDNNILDNIIKMNGFSDYVMRYPDEYRKLMVNCLRVYGCMPPKIFTEKLVIYMEKMKCIKEIIDVNKKRISDEIDSLWRIIKSKVYAGIERQENINSLKTKLEGMIRCFNETKHVKMRAKLEKILKKAERRG